MSLPDSLALALAHLGALQLGCAFVAAMTYPQALDATLSARSRTVLGGVALAAATAFAASLPHWPSGVALMLFAVAGLAVFTALTWLTSLALGLAGSTAVAPAAVARTDDIETPGRRPAATLPRPA